MIMDHGFSGFSGSLRGFRFDDETLLPCPPDQHMNYNNGFKYNDHYSDPSTSDLGLVEHHFDQETSNSAPSSILSTEGDCFSDDEYSDTLFKYIGQMLMEEDMEDRSCMFLNPLDLEATEKSLYDVLGEKQPSSTSPSYSSFYAESPDNNYYGSSSEFSGKITSPCSFVSGVNSVEHHGNTDFSESRPLILQSPLPENFVFQSAATTKVLPTFTVPNSLVGTGSETMNTSVNNLLVPNFSTESDLLRQFQRGVEEASKFLPKVPQIQVFPDLQNTTCYAGSVGKTLMGTVKVEDDHRYSLLNGLSGKKNHERGDVESEDKRSHKQLAVYVEETELAEMLDKLLICPRNGRRGPPWKPHAPQENDVSKSLLPDGHANGSIGGKAHIKKPVTDNKEVVDLRTLLVLCAQAVSADDRRTAELHLKQIRQHSSPFGDGSQRLAHCFANGLEARLAGTGSQIYASLTSKKTSAIDTLKAHHAYITACPFQKMASIFANHNFLHLSEKATTLHVIDFGILYGFQWPPLIFRLSKRPGGPPKLRITGIELPQRGFRPAERVQETGRRLAECCERFNVPFEYNGIAQKWETIQLEDLKLRNDEVVVVNCLFRFKHLLDETVAVNNPKDSVLELIRRINPALFVHSVVNGTFNAPFFVTRFREALFHYSAMFDAFDTNLEREDPMRLMYEKEFFGREVINIIACEGTERIERPETYKQWQIRHMRAGFKQVPVDQLLIRKLLFRLHEGYQDDFVVDEDGHWMIQGWKGRILFASSGWVPA